MYRAWTLRRVAKRRRIAARFLIISAVKSALEKTGLKPELAEIAMKPTTETPLSGEDAARMQKLLDALESLDDVQDVYTTAVFED